VAFDPEPWGNGVLLRLRAPLREGATYTLRSNMDVGMSLPCYCDGVPTTVSVFEAGPPVTLPARLHARASDATSTTMSVPTRSGSCTSEEDVLAVALSLHPSPELLAFAPLLRTRVILGHDQIWCGTEGRGCRGVTLAAACSLPRDDGVDLLRPGIYRVRVEGGLIGKPDLAPSTIDVRLCCEDAECPDRRVPLEELTARTDLVRNAPLPFAPDDGTPPQEVGTGGDPSGGEGGDGGGGAGGEVAAGTGGVDDQASVGRPSAATGGCGCSSGGSSGVVLLAPLLWLKRRRRPRLGYQIRRK
jgi:uncharacterized protein (TIGR03382 family)